MGSFTVPKALLVEISEPNWLASCQLILLATPEKLFLAELSYENNQWPYSKGTMRRSNIRID